MGKLEYKCVRKKGEKTFTKAENYGQDVSTVDLARVGLLVI